MKIILLLQIFVISLLSGNVFAYSGCREIYQEYDTKIWEKYNIDIGNGNDIYFVLRCSSDCYSLSMGGDRHGSATLCGTKKAEGSWSYNACGEGTKSASYGTNVGGVGDLMLSQCNKASNREIDVKNREIDVKNSGIRKRNKRISREGVDSSKKRITETQDRIKSVNSLIDLYSDTSEKSKCLKKGITKLKKAISLFTLAKKKYSKAVSSSNNIKQYYDEGKYLYNKGVGEYNTSTKSCFSDSKKSSHDKSELFSHVVKDRVETVKKSIKTKKYYGKWKSQKIKVYIKWNNYSKNEKISGVIETLEGRVIETFTGNNYAYRKIKITLGTGEIINLEADTNGDVKKWSSKNIKFSRKYK